ncbi:helix-turn-helix domain-containing protein [Streptomyces cyaneogriseus]|uniref:helix-turn-helix domain-containing protein n=1 Tax=Streptomyces cyaneogriseus TaxID=68192 RepID=UPI00069A36BB|nr:helix-turn-helix transcriptional regulator [Streptomyces cyaneogriseus]
MWDDETTSSLEKRLLDNLLRVERLRQRLPAAVRPSLRDLARRAGCSHNTIDNWLRGKTLPGDVEILVKVIGGIRQAAVHAAVSDQDAALLDGCRWREWHAAVNHARVRDAERERRARKARADLADTRAPQGPLTDPPRPVRHWTAAQLGVHPSISGTGAHTRGFTVPAYVERPHDEDLRQALNRAVTSDESVLVIVRGGSCTGKTRSAYEALNAVGGLADWDLVCPRTQDGALEILTDTPWTPRTILWLDDAHHILSGHKGEELAALLCSRLSRPGPAVVMATAWDTWFAELTGVSDDAAPGGTDPHRHARALLGRATVAVRVPLAFGPDDLRCLEALGDDPALAVARQSCREGKITQTLAAGLQLADRYASAHEPPACYTRALVTAAMDACRLGWDAPLPDGFLRDAAPGYLSDDQRTAAGPDWFATALADARTRVQHVAAALEPLPRPDGMGPLPGFSRLADYLDAHGRATRDEAIPPPTFWAAASRYVLNARFLARLCREAQTMDLRETAEQLARQAAEAGEPGVYAVLAEARERAGDQLGAEHMARLAAEAEDPSAYAMLAWMRERAGNQDSAVRLGRLAAAAGYPHTLREMAESRARAGNLPDAERLARFAARAGDHIPLYRLAVALERDGDLEGAERLHLLAARAGARRAWSALTSLRERAGDRQGAEEAARLAADMGRPNGYAALARLRAAAGDHTSAERFARLAAEAGDRRIRQELAGLRQDT